MFWLIETNNKLEELRDKKLEKVFIELIPLNNLIHPAINDVCALYIRGIYDTKGFLINISHTEATQCDLDKIYSLLGEFKDIFVRDKKEFLHYFLLKQLTDLHFISPTDIPEPTPTHNFFYKKHPEIANINAIIPIVKHYEYCEDIFKAIQPILILEKPPHFEFYNNRAINVFWWVEAEGLKVDPKLFEEYFGVKHDWTYSQFNLKTTTTRPSNSFGGVNYAALDKNNGCRAAFIPNNDFLLEIDISAYHPTLAAQLINYKFEYEDIHQAFANMYGVDYKTAKELTFKQLYGGVFEEYKELEFFKQVEKYIDDISSREEYTCLTGYIFKTDMKKQKLFNYILQNTETYYNVLILERIIGLLKNNKTRIIHYVYDSFLLDVDKNEQDAVKSIINIFGDYGFRVKIGAGPNYDSLVPIPYV